jgi:ribonucleoside-triphosphate reductase
MIQKEQEILSNVTIFEKYAKFKPEFARRETWNELVSRYLEMMTKSHPTLTDEIKNYGQFIYDKKVLPSMRALQFAGNAIEANESRIYNCAFLPIDNVLAFSETMFLLLGGTGVGYSVQYEDIAKLNPINKPIKSKKFIVEDSIEGWADAVKALMKSYLGNGKNLKPRFDFSRVRPKGARLVTAGGKAPGPEPLKTCLFLVETILERKQNGEFLVPIEAHDILCHIANAVLAGGIRRAAMIALFSPEDKAMLTCKHGAWYELNEQRGRANNSVVLLRSETAYELFSEIFHLTEVSNAGEPGISWTNDRSWGFNPCHEISLRPFQFCNLCEINVSNIQTQEDLNARAEAAAFFGTLQASFTDFHYLRSIWQETTEKEALIGIGMTGIASGNILKLNEIETANIVKAVNEKYAKILGINQAARTTTIKPSGSTSCVLGTSSGIHAWHNEYYLRRIRIAKNSMLDVYLRINLPEFIEDDKFKVNQSIISIPQKAPEGSLFRTESTFELLDRVMRFNRNWVQEGHNSGVNYNNVSATLSIREGEWNQVRDYLWDNRENYSGISMLPYDGGTYEQAPFEDITKEKYEELVVRLHEIDITQIIELDDETNLTGEAACAGGLCSI